MSKGLILATARTGATAVLLVVLPGCIVGEIRDDLAGTRAGVERLGPALEQTAAALDKSNQQLEGLHAQLQSMDKSLGLMLVQLEQANSELRASSKQLAHLEAMRATMRNLDESVAGLRKNIENIDKAIPLIDISKGTPPADRLLEKQKEERAHADSPHNDE